MQAFSAPTVAARTLKWLVALIAVVTVARLILAATLGLGIDEAYTVATARTLDWGTFEHPPIAWWLAGGMAKLAGSESPLIVRLPFILLGAVTMALAYDAGRVLYSARAGLYAAVVIALAPVLGWTSGSMVLPDGPLLAGLLAGLSCLARALFGNPLHAPRWWLLAGAAAGFACLAKLHGAVLLAGTGLFLVTTPTHRHWLLRPWPYLAALVTLVVVSPFLIWNIQHEWISFSFQMQRAKVRKLDLAGPFVALGGQALFLLPWVWWALMLSLARAMRHGPRRPHDWLLVCCGIIPIALFTLVTLTGTKTLFHWAAPGYLFVCLLLGRDVAGDLAHGVRRTTLWLKWSIAAIAGIFVIALGLAARPWQPLTLAGQSVPDPLGETRSWRPLTDALKREGLYRPGSVIAGVKWHEASRLAVALGPDVPVICLCTDPRSFGVVIDNRRFIGRDVLVVSSSASSEETRTSLAPYFANLSKAEGTFGPFSVWRGSALREPAQTTQNLIQPFKMR